MWVSYRQLGSGQAPEYVGDLYARQRRGRAILSDVFRYCFAQKPDIDSSQQLQPMLHRAAELAILHNLPTVT